MYQRRRSCRAAFLFLAYRSTTLRRQSLCVQAAVRSHLLRSLTKSLRRSSFIFSCNFYQHHYAESLHFRFFFLSSHIIIIFLSISDGHVIMILISDTVITEIFHFRFSRWRMRARKDRKARNKERSDLLEKMFACWCLFVPLQKTRRELGIAVENE